MERPTTPITELLQAWQDGDGQALDALIAELYGELRRLAGSYLRRERPGHTLQATALVHEVFLRLHRQRRIDWRDRGHFFALAATLMRRILVDHARHRQMARRHGRDSGVDPAAAPESAGLESAGSLPAVDLVALDQALERLGHLSPELTRTVELRFFAGLTFEEAGEVLGVSARTVKRRWAAARLWLFHALSEDSSRAA